MNDTISQILVWFNNNSVSFTAIITLITLTASVLKFIYIRSKEFKEQQYNSYHKLIKRIVAPEKSGEVIWLQRQCAAIFELRHFPRYFEITKRILIDLDTLWTSKLQQGLLEPRLHEMLHREIVLTIDYIKKRNTCCK